MKKFRQFFQEKIILSAVMCVLLAVVLTTATTAWYAINNSTKTYGLDIKLGGIGGIKVATTAGGEDIMADPNLPKNEDGYPIISINLREFENIQSGRIAPGAYGQLPFYITALGENVKFYSIKVQMEYRPASASVTEEQRQKIQDIINDHISVYTSKYTDGDGIVRFENPLTYYVDETDAVTAATGPLIYMEEVFTEIYWVWNYELTDIPDYDGIERFHGMDTRKAVRAYDEEDTTLGNYIDDIWFNIYIEGMTEEAGD